MSGETKLPPTKVGGKGLIHLKDPSLEATDVHGRSPRFHALSLFPLLRNLALLTPLTEMQLLPFRLCSVILEPNCFSLVGFITSASPFLR